jgi:hypothetical protein
VEIDPGYVDLIEKRLAEPGLLGRIEVDRRRELEPTLPLMASDGSA